MTTVTLEEIQRNLPGYLERVRAGETLLITQADIPLAEIKPVPPVAQQLRPFGLCRGEFVTPDDFDAPLPDEVLTEYFAEIDGLRERMQRDQVEIELSGARTDTLLEQIQAQLAQQ